MAAPSKAQLATDKKELLLALTMAHHAVELIALPDGRSDAMKLFQESRRILEKHLQGGSVS